MLVHTAISPMHLGFCLLAVPCSHSFHSGISGKSLRKSLMWCPIFQRQNTSFKTAGWQYYLQSFPLSSMWAAWCARIYLHFVLQPIFACRCCIILQNCRSALHNNSEAANCEKPSTNPAEQQKLIWLTCCPIRQMQLQPQSAWLHCCCSLTGNWVC